MLGQTEWRTDASSIPWSSSISQEMMTGVVLLLVLGLLNLCASGFERKPSLVHGGGRGTMDDDSDGSLRRQKRRYDRIDTVDDDLEADIVFE
jgi:hypothetical protein